MSVFSNTTPFIALSSVGLLDLLPTIFGEVYVAPSVVQECREGGSIFVPDLTGLPWIKIQAISNSAMRLPALFELDRGERDTLLLAIQAPQSLVVMDEKLGRNTAEYLGLRVTGTLGVLAKARMQGLIPSFTQVAQHMREQGIYYQTDLLRKIAVRIGENN